MLRPQLHVATRTVSTATLKNLVITASAFAAGGVLLTATAIEGDSGGRTASYIEVPAEYTFTTSMAGHGEITGDTFHASRVEPTGVLTGGYTVSVSDASTNAEAIADAAVVAEIDASTRQDDDVAVATVPGRKGEASSDVAIDADLDMNVGAIVDLRDGALDVSLDGNVAILAISLD